MIAPREPDDPQILAELERLERDFGAMCAGRASVEDALAFVMGEIVKLRKRMTDAEERFRLMGSD